MKAWFRILIPILICVSVLAQKTAVNDRFSYVLNNPECKWCVSSDPSDQVSFIPYKTLLSRLPGPADPDFLASLLWGRTAYYFGSHAITDKSYPYLAFLLDRITDLSPRWKQPYWTGTVMLLLEAKEPLAAMTLVTKGIKALPGVWELFFLKGYIFWKQFNDYEAASFFFSRAAALDESPAYLGDLALTFARKAGKNGIDAVFSELMDKNVTDPAQKQILLRRKKEK